MPTKRMNPSRPGVFRGALPLVAALVTVGCGNSGSDDTSGTGEPLTVVFAKAYSAYDGVRTFKVPVLVPDVTGVKWKVSNPALAELEALVDDPAALGSEAVLTTKGAGTVEVTATLGNRKGTAVLEITQASPDVYDIGRARYTNGVMLQPGQAGTSVDRMIACTNCHGMGGQDVEHTPAQTGGYSDQELINIFTMGVKPEGIPNRLVPREQWRAVHQWQMSEQERMGIVVYLRSLEPQSHGTADFGGQAVFRNNRRRTTDGGMRTSPADGGAGQ